MKCYNCDSPDHRSQRCCSGCFVAVYCDRKCQKQDWKSHKPECKALVNTIKTVNTDELKAMKKHTSISSCAFCRSLSNRYRKCKQCGVRYCNSECQLQHWSDHKYQCRMEPTIPIHPITYKKFPSKKIKEGNLAIEGKHWNVAVDSYLQAAHSCNTNGHPEQVNFILNICHPIYNRLTEQKTKLAYLTLKIMQFEVSDPVSELVDLMIKQDTLSTDVPKSQVQIWSDLYQSQSHAYAILMVLLSLDDDWSGYYRSKVNEALDSDWELLTNHPPTDALGDFHRLVRYALKRIKVPLVVTQLTPQSVAESYTLMLDSLITFAKENELPESLCLLSLASVTYAHSPVRIMDLLDMSITASQQCSNM
jgi:hypothetical protein